MTVLNAISIVSRSLRHKMTAAFSLMTVIPLLAYAYLISPYLAPDHKDLVNLAAVILVSMVISILGFFVARNVVDSVIGISAEARKISEGDYDRRIGLSGEDEIGSLGKSINVMTGKIKSSLDELDKLSSEMQGINVEAQKKTYALSGLLQIDEMIAARSFQIDTILELAVEKTSRIFDTGFGVLYIPRKTEGGDFIAKVCFNVRDEDLDRVVIKQDGHGVLDTAVKSRRILQVCGGSKLTDEIMEFKGAHNLVNFVVVPLYSDRTVFGLLLTGNRLSDFKYTNDDIDLITVFAKHLTIAIESDVLERNSRDLAAKDDLTGLYNKRYLLAQLEDEIKRAIFYRRPCSFAVFSADNFRSSIASNSELVFEEAIKRIAKAIRDNIIPIGKAARLEGADFAMILPEKNKHEAAYIADDMRRRIENANLLKNGRPAFAVSAGVSGNPMDGATSDEIFVKAMVALKHPKGLDIQPAVL